MSPPAKPDFIEYIRKVSLHFHKMSRIIKMASKHKTETKGGVMASLSLTFTRISSRWRRLFSKSSTIQ